MRAKVACFTTGNPLTMACVHIYENSRAFRMAPPGKQLVWGPRDNEPIETDIAAPYGICIFDDHITIEPDPLGEDKYATRERTIPGTDRAADMARAERWRNYGGVRIQGDAPTAEDERLAKANRRKWGEHQVQTAIYNYRQAQAGKAGFHAYYSDAVRAWAEELGIALPDTIGAMDKLSKMADRDQTNTEDRVACPECAEDIKPQAKKCRYCGASFGKPIGEVIEEKNAAEVKQLETLFEETSQFESPQVPEVSESDLAPVETVKTGGKRK